MPELTPITREEKLWSGEDIEPITREEMYIKHIFDKTQTIPSKPLTRKEILLEKAGEGGGSDVDIKQLSVTANGTYSEEGTAYSPVIVNVPAPPIPDNAYLLNEVEGLPKDIATFTDGSDLPMPKLEVAIEPVQDLHGYDAPWVGGAGKNKLLINSLSISGGGITTNIDRDSNNNVVSITINGTASGTVYVILNTFTLPSGTYTMSGCPSNGGSDSYKLYDDKHTSWADNGSGASFTLSEASQVAPTIRIANGYTVNNLKFYPMIESGSSKTTFAPYSNICPISGWDECNVTRTGKNLYGGIDFANSVKDASPRSAIDTTNKTVTYSYGTGNKTTIFDTFKPLTSYTFLFKVADCGGQNFSMRIAYTDGTVEGIEILPSDIGNYVRKVSDPNKTVSKLAVMWYQTTLVKLYYDECGIFEGNIQTTDFASYQGQTYTIDLNGTRYGGKVDLVSGVLTVDRVSVDLGTVNWDKYTSSAKTYFRTSAQLSDAKKSDSPSTTHNLMCSNYKEDTWSHVIDSSGYDGNICIGWNNNAYIGIYDSRYADASESDFKTAMNGVQLVYELATPLTIQLTPTVVKSLKGVNNVFADTGNILDLSYLAKEE